MKDTGIKTALRKLTQIARVARDGQFAENEREVNDKLGLLADCLDNWFEWREKRKTRILKRCPVCNKPNLDNNKITECKHCGGLFK